MRNSAWVATIALLFLGAAPAFAQEEVKSEDNSEATVASGETDRVEDHTANDNPDCLLGPVHFEHLEGNDLVLQKQYDDAMVKLQALEAALANGGDVESEIADLKRKLEDLQRRGGDANSAMQGQLERIGDALENGVGIYDPDNYPWRGWHWSLSAVGQVVTLNEVGYAVPFRLEGAVRWVAMNHMGIDLGLGLGGWATEDTTPWNAAGHAFFLTNWKYVGIFAGMELQYMQSPYEKERDNIATFAWGGLEYISRHLFFARVGIGTPVFNRTMRDGVEGLWLGAWIGFLDGIGP